MAQITIVPYNPAWPELFMAIAQPIRQGMGNNALAIHHIGSTSVPGLAAKDIVDIQVTVKELDKAVVSILEQLGFVFLEHITGDHRPPGRNEIPEAELTKLFFTKRTEPRANLHIRVAGTFNQNYPLLCRDYLRATPFAAQAYMVVKQQLAKYFPHDMDAYYDIKDPVFDILMEGAYLWAKETGWRQPLGDM